MPNYTAQEIYSVVSKHSLTPEQEQAISGASTEGPSLVIAGAGSGKTELMAVRTLYLVANQLANPNQILGLTFTRKAATELAIRVQQGLLKLRESKFWPSELTDDFEPAKITTYNSFGNEIFRSLSLQVGYESDALVLTEAGAISLAREIISGAGIAQYPALEFFDKSLDHLVSKVLFAAGELTDNQCQVETAIEYLQDFAAQISSLPKTEKPGPGVFAYHQATIDEVSESMLIFELAGEYQRQKKLRGLVDFSDQVALALRALETQKLEVPQQFVLLDEYQDTSGIQTLLLSKLFAGKPVMAVGDPNQAIYGWRGASSANLSGFNQDFGPGESFSLSTSWRSGANIVAAANRVSSQLKDEANLAPVTLRAGLDTQGRVLAKISQDEVSESRVAANWLAEKVNSENSAAVLFRSKQAMRQFALELEEAGLTVEITGLSGLLEQPEVIDLISALKVVADPEAGADLMRILTGPKFRIGPRDIAKLHQFGKTLGRLRQEVTREIPITLVEALDEIRKPSARELAEVSAVGLERLIDASELFNRMRTQLSLGVAEFAWVLARELEIDIELYAHKHSKLPLANLEGFISRIADYEASAMRPSLQGLLSWLDYAAANERFELPKTGAKLGVVQLMSVHAAKGLEWDYVVVAGLVRGSFPVESRGAKGWLQPGKLPHDLRQDRDYLPGFSWRSASTQKDLKAAIEQFSAQNRIKHEIEERRLAYVAITRAGKELMLTASYYKPGIQKPRELAPYLMELVNDSLVELTEEIPEPLVANPLKNLNQTQAWPFDPLGVNREKYLQASAAVTGATPVSISQNLQLAAIIDQAEKLHQVIPPELPKRLSASKVMQLLSDPVSFQQSLLRPMPVSFSSSAARGTAFHAQLEKSFLLEQELEVDSFDEDQQGLGQNFLGSRFKDQTPQFVEQSLEFELAGTVIVCKLDAVYQQGSEYEIVDWKSGSAPVNKTDIESRAVQLALYRIGFARWQNIGVEKVKALFYFAGDDKELAPDLPSESEIASKLLKIRRALHPSTPAQAQ